MLSFNQHNSPILIEKTHNQKTSYYNNSYSQPCYYFFPAIHVFPDRETERNHEEPQTYSAIKRRGLNVGVYSAKTADNAKKKNPHLKPGHLGFSSIEKPWQQAPECK